MEPFNCNDIINGFEFERYLSVWLNSVGFQANVTKASHDDGVDVIAINPITKNKYYIQCKLQFKKLSNKPIQEIYAATALNGNDGTPVVWTNNLFSDGAKDYARKLGVMLVGKNETDMLNGSILGEKQAQTYGYTKAYPWMKRYFCSAERSTMKSPTITKPTTAYETAHSISIQKASSQRLFNRQIQGIEVYSGSMSCFVCQIREHIFGLLQY